MSYVIRCYEGQDEWGSKKWLAHLNLGNDLFMSFLRGTKKEAESAAREWYERESKRFKHQDSCGMDSAPKMPTWGNNDGWSNASREPTKGHHGMTGKIWMVNKATNDKKRIDPSEQAVYEANGYVRGGPRS